MVSKKVLTNIRFGMVNYLRTGNVFIDMIIASFIPMLIAKATDNGYKYAMKLYMFIKSFLYQKDVIVEFEQSYDRQGNSLSNNLGIRNSCNLTFFKALRGYLATYNIVDGSSNIVMSYEPTSDTKRGEELLAFKFSSLPINNTWVNMENDVSMMIYNDTSKDKDGKTDTSSYFIRFKGRSRKQIDDVVQKIFNHHVEKTMELQDVNTRYLYTLETNKAIKADKDKKSSSNDNGHIKARRYKMMLQKSFDSIFFPQKKELLTVIDAFMHKTGVYSIKGYAHKLGLMLHGEPGTGKTSIIKALANYTKRHIVMVSLNKIKTNSELIDLMFDPNFQVINEDLQRPVKVTQSECIFVFEDIDACTDIVKSREDSDSVSSETGSKKSETVVFIGEKSEEYIKPIPDDALTLAGILNVLDGPLEAENRIVIFTSNHPETLDSALIRPGRIDYKFYLTYSTVDDICSMIELYFGHCEEKVRSDLEHFFKSQSTNGPPMPRFTPANLEVIAIKSKDQYEFLHNIMNI